MYRQQALAVFAALQTLQVMSADLREHVSRPALTGPKIPVEVHMKSIKIGLERLREGRVKGKELDEAAMKRVLSINDVD